MANGTPELGVAMNVTRFWLNVDRRGRDDCWPWNGGVGDGGYGYFNWGGRRYGAHEMALAFASGKHRPSGYETCHACNNPPCCNPRHLRFGTSASNKADAIAADRHNRGERHPHARFTDAEVVIIRRRLAAGETGRSLAAEFDISPSAISKIRTGRAWKHVEEPVLIPYERTVA